MNQPTETHTDLQNQRSTSEGELWGLVPIFSELEKWPDPLAVTAKPIVVGRDEAQADWVFQDGKVSRRHAVFSVTNERLVVRDLESRNGVYVEGDRIDGERPLRAGSLIRVGRTLLLATNELRRYAGFPPPLLVGPLVGGPSLDELRRTVRRVAPSPLAVLITGETGTGKELAATMVHRASGRNGRLVSVNCAAIPSELVESELFGHAAGAFSGNRGARAGLFREAHRGTLFFDEVAELPLATQAKLLRVLEDQHVRPVGADRGESVDVRVVAATHRDLPNMATRQAFREDLMHRLAAVTIHLPPLRDRREDIPLLVRHFVPDLAFSVGAMEVLCGGEQQGNVRALRSRIDRAVLAARSEKRDRVERGDVAPLPTASVAQPIAEAPATEVDDVALRARIETALAIHRGNVARVARALGMGRSTLYEQLKRFGIAPADYRGG